MDTNYQSNSHKSKQEAREQNTKNVQKVVNGTAKVKQKSELRKFADNFISEDASSVGSHIFTDVIVPGILKIITDSVKDGIDIIFKGAPSRNSRNSSGYQADYVSYNQYSNRRQEPRRTTTPSKSVHSPSDITLASRADAEAVLNQLYDMLAQYGAVTVADLYDSVGISHNYTDNKYGWTSLNSAEVMRDNEGWFIKLPKAYPLDH